MITGERAIGGTWY